MFAMKLALRMGCTVYELTQRMTVAEFFDWMAFDRLSPIGDERADLHAGIVAYAAVMPHVRRGSSLKVSTFVPKWVKQSSEESIRSKLLGLVYRTGGSIK